MYMHGVYTYMIYMYANVKYIATVEFLKVLSSRMYLNPFSQNRLIVEICIMIKE